MKKILIALALTVVVASVLAQNYRSNPGDPSRTELRFLKGVTEYIQDGARYGILRVEVGAENIVTNNNTNGVVVLESASALTNCFLQMQSPTNRTRHMYHVVAKGNVTVVLTTSNITAANSVGPGFDTMTNLTAATYTIPTNSSAMVINNRGTNWLVVPGAK